ncbi:MAG TPA: hypothetical protein VIK35_09600 [Verrucomicrobiae bacterium]
MKKNGNFTIFALSESVFMAAQTVTSPDDDDFGWHDGKLIRLKLARPV